MGINELTLVILAGTFVGIALLVVVPYWLFIGRAEAASQASILRRLRTGTGASTATEAPTLQREERFSSIEALNSALARSTVVSGWLSTVIHQSGLSLTVGQYLLGTGCLVLAAYLVVTLYVQLWWVGLVAAAGVLFLPYSVLRFLAGRRLRQFEEQFPEAIDLIARTLRAGHAFATGLRMAAEELPQPVAGEFQMLHDQQNYGLPLPDAMRAFAERVPIIDARFFVTAVLTQREAGGNLAEVLDNLATVIRERFKIKRQLRVITAHGRLTGWLLTAMPPAMALVLAFQVPKHFNVLWDDPLGRQMIAVAIGLQILGAFVIRKVTNVDY